MQEQVKSDNSNIEVKSSYTEEEHKKIINQGFDLININKLYVYLSFGIIDFSRESKFVDNYSINQGVVDKSHVISVNFSSSLISQCSNGYYEINYYIEKLQNFYSKYYPNLAHQSISLLNNRFYTQMPISKEQEIAYNNNIKEEELKRKQKENDYSKKYEGKYEDVVSTFYNGEYVNIIKSIFGDNFKIGEWDIFGYREYIIATKGAVDPQIYANLKKYFRNLTYYSKNNVTSYALGVAQYNPYPDNNSPYANYDDIDFSYLIVRNTELKDKKFLYQKNNIAYAYNEL